MGSRSKQGREVSFERLEEREGRREEVRCELEVRASELLGLLELEDVDQ